MFGYNKMTDVLQNTNFNKEKISQQEEWMKELTTKFPQIDDGLILHLIKAYQASPKGFSSFVEDLKKDPKKYEDKDIKDESQLKYESTPEELQKYTDEIAQKWKEEDESKEVNNLKELTLQENDDLENLD
jgi:hypothetical protein